MTLSSLVIGNLIVIFRKSYLDVIELWKYCFEGHKNAKCLSTCKMVDCITICNTACITCIWCILFSVCFPGFSKNLKKVDSSECCVPKKPIRKHRNAHLRDIPKCVKADSVRVRWRFKDPSCFECNREDGRGHRSYLREKMCNRESGECRNARRCMTQNRPTSPIDSKQNIRIIQIMKHPDSCNGSDSSLNRKNNNAVCSIDGGEHVCKKS
ncbi:uncharacterized protein [Linepithema humile]|uniref:uncharacterized protein n=1 Tax=Linepithema humile TaxID=83485 RepID=UPI0006233E6D|nr:PREDICTED: uncharacterized protein LOC105672526 [Linepithema humile]